MPRGSWIRAWWGALAAPVLACVSASVPADDTQWRDYESRIQFAYYTEDARALKSVAAGLAQNESHDPLRGYYLALAAWRLAQLPARPGADKGPSAGDYVQQCVRELAPVLAAQPDFSEGYALRAACAATPAGGLHVPFTGPSPAKDAARALELAPRNPRALFALALTDYHAGAASRERALGELRRAVAAFEAEREGATPLPGWGAAEAYVFLGRDLMDHGDGAGARDAFEHALLLVPDYAEARRLLGKLTAG